MNDQNFDQSSYRPPINEYVPPQPIRPGLDLKAAFRSGLFLTICILMTIAVIFGSVSIDIGEGNFSFFVNVIDVIILIGMWITFAAANNPNEPMKKSGLTLISGSIYAVRIIFWVSAIMLIVIGVMMVLLGTLVPAELYSEMGVHIDQEMQEIISEFDEIFGYDFYEVVPGANAWATIIPLFFITMGIVFALIAVVMMILNILCYKKLHMTAKSLCACVDDPYAEVQYAHASSVWLLVLGIFNILSGLNGVVMIIGYVFIKKHIIDQLENYTIQ